MKLFGSEKKKGIRRTYFFGIKLYEEIKQNNTKKVYLFGICIRKKRYIKSKSLLSAAEKNVILLSLLYLDTPKSQKYFLCFDNLLDYRAEAIDAWTMFNYLQSKNIPAKYVILDNNPLYVTLQEKNQLNNIIPISRAIDLLTDHPDIIAKTRVVLSSFGYPMSKIFKILPTINYVFIEHGVTYLKEWTMDLYNEDRFDRIVTPIKPTYNLHQENMRWTNKMYCCGMARWDNLPKQKKANKKKNIFMLFTYRCSFAKNAGLRNDYIYNIQLLINEINSLIKNQSDICVQIAPHHTLLHIDKDCNFDTFKNVSIISPNAISQAIRETDLFITDYSSAAFDLMYRDIPCLFYCFDEDKKFPDWRDEASKSAISKIKNNIYNVTPNCKMSQMQSNTI
ncbi:MAG: CDP-glycerol glycerophosphotransferase family protein [Akkermansia sp.]|nr:CDP-glycerol glycerophosphotransferase family protein [Akkermansia sp.]